MQVLLGTDGSTHSRLAEEVLLHIPEWKSAEVTVASVAPTMVFGFAAAAEPGMSGAYAEQAAAAYETGVRSAHDYADAAVSRLKDRGVNATAAYLEGDPGSELLEFAERNQVAAVAIGSRGMGALASMLLGSVARKLVANAPCHVLVGRATRDEGPEETLSRYQKQEKLAVMVGVDGSQGSEVAIEFLKRQGSGAFARLIAACAEPLSIVPSGVDPTAFVELYKYDHERAQAIAARVAEEFRPVCSEAAGMTELGRPAAAISKLAQEHETDLVVVGATRHGTLERFLIGSVSYELATESPCSVLVVRPGPAST